ncbi:glycoside hydrolase family 18 protein [Gloeophyllum trabeum ATCC 11539]|uniref:Glycoside hydrolase family 18 protein n=1 Tax=Gloeophyllum trabeum (strain ATCC 11539 / FP-39264 / Madison 617) TaxID=670483 RepID=S7PTD3_GLOTA|nr:glycoside hydrolase family 18 protein [Gloeophyllum trabeum ATCC 11539]EPQ50562.1 glycoside hydrolase family 18 protein [Gloeophyllum trabeum ATCC 11539]
MPVTTVSISKHTTASLPRPHVLYIVDVKEGNRSYAVTRRYSEFVALHSQLGDPFTLPPKRLLVTTFLPSAWVDDQLIAERKAGLAKYLADLLSEESFRSDPALLNFLSATGSGSTRAFDLEDALPSTLPRKAAMVLLGNVEAKATTPIAAAYYPDWVGDSNPPENLDYSKFDILLFAFATPNSSSTISWDSGATSLLKRLVSAANNSGHGTKVVLSIGGWGGSYWFSNAMSSSSNRTSFVNACVSAVNTYGLAGIDIDWEYPNESGAGNPYSASDAANLLSFFQQLRSSLGSSKIISAAVTQQPWIGSNGSPLSNVSAYASVMTYVNIMNYDVFGASSNPGPNAPLGNLCSTSSQPQASAEAAFSAWTKAGMPASKLLLGLPLYGYVSKSTATHLYGTYKRPGKSIMRPSEEEEGEVKLNALAGEHARYKGKNRAKEPMVSAKAAGDLSSYYGQQIAFNQIVALGALQKQSNGTYTGANGYTMGWDDCSDTPFLFNTSRSTVVTYDDTYSLGDKAAYAKQQGMAGCFTWSLDQDDGYTLQNVIRSNLGK